MKSADRGERLHQTCVVCVCVVIAEFCMTLFFPFASPLESKSQQITFGQDQEYGRDEEKWCGLDARTTQKETAIGRAWVFWSLRFAPTLGQQVFGLYGYICTHTIFRSLQSERERQRQSVRQLISGVEGPNDCCCCCCCCCDYNSLSISFLPHLFPSTCRSSAIPRTHLLRMILA